MEYTLKRSARRSIAVQIKSDGSVIVRVNYSTPLYKIEKFLSEKSEWIAKHVAKVRSACRAPEFTKSEIKEFTGKAKSELPERVAYFAQIIGVSYGKITVKKMRTVWGSCSARGNLNFNCLIAAIPQEIADYIIVHELCHRREMNHSSAFWRTVEKYLPDYKACRKWLKTDGAQYLARIK
ncbi:MAG: M48 family metallopeptidase [Clostridia bacterium]|nr:M48 family metallopeptidase [Clostridia bacterium]